MRRTPVVLIASALLLASLLAFSAGAVAWEDCPYGFEDDPYPGACRRYVDSDGDGFCDQSQPPPGERDDGSNATAPAVTTSSASLANRYNVLPLLAIISTLYGVTYLLSLSGKMSQAAHRKLWNWALLAAFAVSGTLGVLMAFSLDFGWRLPFKDTIFVHVELGIVMAAIGFYHTAWHWRYYLGPLLGRREEDGEKEGGGRRKGRR